MTLISHPTRPLGPVAHLAQSLRRHLARRAHALSLQTRLSNLPTDALRDTHLSPEALTGAPSYDPALPFFLQSRFGRQKD